MAHGGGGYGFGYGGGGESLYLNVFVVIPPLTTGIDIMLYNTGSRFCQVVGLIRQCSRLTDVGVNS